MIFIAGATGFVGTHLINALLTDGYKLRCLARSDKAQQFLKMKGIEVSSGDITMPQTIKGALKEIDFVIHLVGIIEERTGATFQKIHVKGTMNLVEEARKARVKHFFYQSALGADRNSKSEYQRTKAEAEDIVRSSGIPYTIFRPSLIVGKGDGFTKKLMDIIKLSPVVPVPGDGKTKFQPVSISDWIKCILMVIKSPEKYNGMFEICGPQHLTYNEILKTLVNVMKVRRKFLHIPAGFMKLSVALAEKIRLPLPVTSEQLRLLDSNNIGDVNGIEKHFGFHPIKYLDALEAFVG